MEALDSYDIIFFDGVCNLCNGFVNFIIDRDKKGRFKFASLQSDAAVKYLSEKNNVSIGENPESIVLLLKSGKVLAESNAALAILTEVGGIYKILGKAGYIFPKGFRDVVYKWIAKNRYRFFGRQESCRLPTSELKERFI